MKKTLTCILTAILVFTIFAGCGVSEIKKSENKDEFIYTSYENDNPFGLVDLNDYINDSGENEDSELVNINDFIGNHDKLIRESDIDDKSFYLLSGDIREVKNKNSGDALPMSDVYPNVSKYYQAKLDVSNGIEYRSLDILTDADDNILYLSYKMHNKLVENREMLTFFQEDCGNVLAGFIDSEWEYAYDKLLREAYNKALENNGGMYWNDYEYGFSDSGDCIVFAIRSPFSAPVE